MPFPSNTYQTKNLPSFRLGMNTLQDAMEISDFELSDSENWSVDEDTMLTSPGYVLYGTQSAAPYWGIFQFVKTDGTQVLLRQRQGKLEYEVDGSGTFTECTLPVVGSPAATMVLTQTPCTFAQLNGTVVWGNGVDSMLSSTDGITWTIPTTGSPAAELPKSFVFNNGKNRLIYFKQFDNKFRIDWTDINAPTTIASASFALVDPNNGWGVYGMAKTPIGSTLLFTEGALYEISDYVDNGIVDINLVADNVRLSSHQSIVTTEDSVIFHAYDGIYEYINGSVRKISGRITPTGRNYVVNLHLVCSGYINGVVYISTPDADISQEYNSQEWMVFKRLYRQDAVQPYVIMRNRRYIGCYGAEYFKSGNESYNTLYFGDSRLGTIGSPAVDISTFAYGNVYRDAEGDQGLGGSSQTSWFITKYFTENVSFHVKRFKKIFAQFELQNSVSYTISYRFQPYGAWVDSSEVLEPTSELNFIFADESTGGFSEGYGFAIDEIGNVTVPVEHENTPRGIQFKVETNQVNDVRLYGMAYNYYIKPQFR